MAVKKETYQYYKAIVAGSGDYRGLRSYMTGFDPADGYDLGNFAHWTKHQRAKIRHAFRVVMQLRSQPHYVFRGRNPEHIKIAKSIAHQDLDIKGLKVAFVKFSPPRSDKTAKPKISFKGGTMKVAGKSFERQFIPFDAKMLATRFADEMMKVWQVSGAAHGKKYFTLQCGAYEKSSPLGDFGSMRAEVTRLMNMYDGASVPKHKRAAAQDLRWRAKDHKWADWLVGVNAYQFAQGASPSAFQRDVEDAQNKGRKKQKMTRRRFLKLKKASKGKK